MTPDRNVEIVERLVEAFIAIGPEATPEDFVWDMSTFGDWPDQPEYHGVAEFADFMRAWREPYDDWSMAVERVVDAGGDRVVAVQTQRGRLRGSDAEVALRFGVVYTVRDGRVRRAQAYGRPAEALAAVGLRE